MVAMLRAQLTYANVMATVAVFIALATGGAYASHEMIFSDDIVDGQVMRPDIANGAIATAKLADGTISTAKYKSLSVTTGVLAPGAVTVGRLGDNAVTGSKIADEAVGTSDLADAAVTPGKVDLLGYDEVLAEESTTSSTYTDLATSGPSVTVDVPVNALVALFAQVRGQPVGLTDCADPPAVGLFEETDFSPPVDLLPFCGVGTKWTAPGFGPPSNPQISGVTAREKAGWLVFPVSPGQRTFTLQYKAGGNASANFSERRLWVMAIQ